MNRFKEELGILEKEGRLRKLLPLEQKSIVNLSSNDYLGIAEDENLRQEFYFLAKEKRIGFGAMSSRLLTGNHFYYGQLESTIASNYQKQAALVFSSGYHANMGIISVLAGKKDLILADKLVHASLIDGMRLSQAEVRRFNHIDYKHLIGVLEKKRKLYDKVWIVTESIYSMDGDEADLKQLVEIKKQFDCYLYVDEAHAIGVRGKRGLGCAEECGCLGEIDFIVGTFGKAFASMGAYVVCDQLFVDFLVNHSRTLIYTTALPPVNVAWTEFIFQKILRMDLERERLNKITNFVNKQLKTKSTSHILPFMVGDSQKAVDLATLLYSKGYKVLPIRSPSVRKGTERLRLSLNTNLSQEKLRPLMEELIRYKNENLLAE